MNLNHPQRRPQKPWTPELERRSAVLQSGHPQVIQEYLDHLERQGIVLARWHEESGSDFLLPARIHMERDFAGFFDLDYDRIEREKLALLRYIRAASAYDEERAAHVARLTSKGKADE